MLLDDNPKGPRFKWTTTSIDEKERWLFLTEIVAGYVRDLQRNLRPQLAVGMVT